jgi:hypothetical protein
LAIITWLLVWRGLLAIITWLLVWWGLLDINYFRLPRHGRRRIHLVRRWRHVIVRSIAPSMHIRRLIESRRGHAA